MLCDHTCCKNQYVDVSIAVYKNLWLNFSYVLVVLIFFYSYHGIFHKSKACFLQSLQGRHGSYRIHAWTFCTCIAACKMQVLANILDWWIAYSHSRVVSNAFNFYIVLNTLSCFFMFLVFSFYFSLFFFQQFNSSSLNSVIE